MLACCDGHAFSVGRSSRAADHRLGVLFAKGKLRLREAKPRSGRRMLSKFSQLLRFNRFCRITYKFLFSEIQNGLVLDIQVRGRPSTTCSSSPGPTRSQNLSPEMEYENKLRVGESLPFHSYQYPTLDTKPNLQYTTSAYQGFINHCVRRRISVSK